MLRILQARFSRAGPAQRTAATALLVGVGYYIGANIGFLLRLPPAIPSVVWPPNSILTATLLLVPRKRWWIYLLAVLPAHLAAELPAGWPLPLVLALFATNCSEALIAALCLRRFSDAPARVDTLRRAVTFIVGAAILAPFLSSFADAAAVATFRGESYWRVWGTRFFSNVLTELTVAPAILTIVCAAQDSPSHSSARRRAEAILLGASLIAAAILIFAVGADPGTSVGSLRQPAAWLLPFLLWSAVRFAPLGASLSLLTTTLIAIWAASHARGPFRALPLTNSVLPLQEFLIVLAIPLMCLAALIDERRRAQDALAERLHFEAFLARLSAAFVHLPGDAIDRAIAAWLGGLGDFLRIDRVALLRFSAEE